MNWQRLIVQVTSTTARTTACYSDHLSSFATGFSSERNSIDFNFVYAFASVDGNRAALVMVALAFVVYVLAMIWAVGRDKYDQREVRNHFRWIGRIKSTVMYQNYIFSIFLSAPSGIRIIEIAGNKNLVSVAVLQICSPLMRDNRGEDAYMYELLVETGPLTIHATASEVQFVLTGDDEETAVRRLSDGDRRLFAQGATDAFLMTTQRPLGNLRYTTRCMVELKPLVLSAQYAQYNI